MRTHIPDLSTKMADVGTIFNLCTPAHEKRGQDTYAETHRENCIGTLPRVIRGQDRGKNALL